MLESPNRRDAMVLLYNSLTQQKERLPKKDSPYSLYVCGLTVYDKAHIGHLRTLLVFDLLIRYLKTQGQAVTYIRNITDIDDKIIHRMHEDNIDWKTLTEGVISDIEEQEKAMGLMPPDRSPKASSHIESMIQMIEILLDKKHAYIADNQDVYFSVTSFQDYGKLSNRNLEEMLKGLRVDEKVKQHPGDFILWKQSKPGEPSWPSPWGEGRPGWHIECSAISTDCLGNTFDIHGGGVDLKFPHHENEIAQSVCATGESFAKHWMHVGHLLVDHEKMSKSLHNFITVEDFLTQYHPELIRLFLLKTHYRQPYNYTLEAVSEMQTVLLQFYLSLWDQPQGDLDPEESHWKDFEAALEDDLNTAKALAVMHEVSIKIAKNPKLAPQLKAMGSVLGILQQDPQTFLQPFEDKDTIENQIKARQAAREKKDFSQADSIRDALSQKGIVLEDGQNTRWYHQKAGIIAES